MLTTKNYGLAVGKVREGKSITVTFRDKNKDKIRVERYVAFYYNVFGRSIKNLPAGRTSSTAAVGCNSHGFLYGMW